MKHSHVNADRLFRGQDILNKSVAQTRPCTNVQTNHGQRRPMFKIWWRNVLIAPATRCKHC